MATRRKLTLADVEGPLERPRINPGGRRPNRVIPIRARRFRPERELFDFRGLSRTISQAFDAMAEVEAASADDEAVEQIKAFAQAGDDFKTQMMQGDDRPVVLPSIPADEEPVPKTGNPTIDNPAPRALPKHLEESKALLAEASRARALSPLDVPMLDKLAGKIRGETAANEVMRTIQAEDMFALKSWNIESNGPEMDFWPRFKERFRQGFELLGGDKEAERHYSYMMLRTAHALGPDVAEAQGRDRTTKEVNQLHIPNMHDTLQRGFDPQTRRDVSQKGVDEHNQALADVITGKLEDMQESGVQMPTVDVAFLMMKSRIKALRSEHRENPFELREQLREHMETFEQVRVGKALAKDHPMFQALEDLAEQVRASTRSKRFDQGDYDKVLMKAGRKGLEAMQGTFTDGVASNNLEDLKRGEDAFREGVNTWIAEHSITGAERLEFLSQAEELLVRQKANFRAAGASDAIADSILQQGMLVGVDEARAQAGDAFRSGRINFDQMRKIEAQLEGLEQAAEFKGPGSTFFSATSEFKTLRTGLVGLNLGQARTTDLLGEMTRAEDLLIRQYNGAIAAARAEGKDPAAAGDKFMQDAGGDLLKVIRANFTDEMKRVETARAEFDQITNTGKVFDDADKRRGFDVLGPGFQAKVTENYNRTRPGMVMAMVAPLIKESENLLDDSISSITQALSKGDPDTDKAISQILRRRGQTLHGSMVHDVIQQLTTTGHANFDAELRARIMEARKELATQLRKFASDQDLKSKVVQQISMSESAVDDIEAARSEGTREQFREKTGLLFSGLHPRLPSLLGEDGRSALSEYLTSVRFDKQADVEKKLQAWFNKERPNLLKRSFRDANLTPNDKLQVEYDIKAMTGGISIKQIENDRLHFPVSNEEINLRAGSVPLFTSEQQLQSFVNSSERFYAVAERLGFTALDTNVEPADNPVVHRWIVLQRDLMKTLGVK
ncbi:MAG: hypothetical protein GY701_28770 [Sulfitobacter sp.]|nr:hypothetical protein [Sulfitobacter sp.]